MEPTVSNSSGSNRRWLWLVGGCLLGCVGLICLLALTGVGYFTWIRGQVTPTSLARDVGITAVPPTPVVPTPTSRAQSVAPREAGATPTPTLAPQASLSLQPPPQITQDMAPARAYDDLEQLLQADYPPHDYYETAVRLGKQKPGPRTVQGPRYQVGERRPFSLEAGNVDAELVLVSDRAYFWVETGIAVDKVHWQAAAERLDTEFYPRLARLFGQEWRPGVDGDPRFNILHVRLPRTTSELGYFSSTDEYPRSIYDNSNEQELIYLNIDQLEVGSDLYYGTLIHEIQHLIQWHVDPNESTWLDEGLSQLAELYLGLETVDADYYLAQPDVRLDQWSYDKDLVDAHYGAAYLFLVYVWEQLGEEAVRELARHPANGMAAVHSVLRGYGDGRSLEQFAADWAIANLLDDLKAGAAYGYEQIDPKRPTFATRLKTTPYETVESLEQFGAHYVDLSLAGPVTITFAADTSASLTDPPPHGDPIWFAPAQNDTNARLTAAVDLRGLETATLTFSAWYDLEPDWDFAYVSVSADGGKTWDVLPARNTRAGEFGPGFNGRSDAEPEAESGWLKEAVTLNGYTGRQVLIRFDVLTDSAVIGRGFAVDDLAVSERAGPLEWQADGFVETGRHLPQQWLIHLVRQGESTQIRPLPLNPANQGRWTVDLGQTGGVVVIIPLTPFSDDIASYWLNIDR